MVVVGKMMAGEMLVGATVPYLIGVLGGGDLFIRSGRSVGRWRERWAWSMGCQEDLYIYQSSLRPLSFSNDND